MGTITAINDDRTGGDISDHCDRMGNGLCGKWDFAIYLQTVLNGNCKNGDYQYTRNEMVRFACSKW